MRRKALLERQTEMSTQATPVARTAKAREDTLHELANTQDGLAKAIRHLSHLADDTHPLVAAIWRNLENAHNYILRAQGDIRTEPFSPYAEDDAA